MENNNFNETIKNRLEQHTLSPSAAVWERIQADLDHDAAALQTANRRRFWWYSAALLAVAGTLLITWNESRVSMEEYAAKQPEKRSIPQAYVTDNEAIESIDLNNSSNTVIPEEIVTTTVQSSPKKRVQSVVQAATADLSEPEQQTALAIEKATINSEEVVATNETVSTEVAANVPVAEEKADQEMLREEVLQATDLLTETEDHLAVAAVEATEDEIVSEDFTEEEMPYEPVEEVVAKKKKNPFKGFYGGFNGGLYGSTLLNGEAVVINDNSLQTGFMVAPSKGLSIGYIFQDNFSLQADYLYNVVKGQNYFMDSEEGNRSKSMTLYFDHIPVMFKLHTPRYIKSLKMPASINIMAGPQLNILRDYQLPQEKLYGELDDDIFRKTTLSVLAGVEYQVMVQKHLMLSLGVDGSVSQNFSTDKDPLDTFNKHSLSLGVRGGVYYHLGSK